MKQAIAALAVRGAVSAGPAAKTAPEDLRTGTAAHSEPEAFRAARVEAVARFTRDERQRRLELLALALGPVPANRRERRDRQRKLRALRSR